MTTSDSKYIGLPWKSGGRTPEGLDCVGLVALFLKEEFGFVAPVPKSENNGDAERFLAGRKFITEDLKRGDVVFFAKKGRGISHVGVWLGGGKLLHIVQGIDSRAENGFVLMERLGLKPVAAIGPDEAELLAKALADSKLGAQAVVMLIVAVALAALSYALTPKLARNGNKYGRYGFDALVTQNSSEIPLADILGEVVVAGNSPYTQLADKNLSATASQQRANKVVVLCSGPVELVDAADFGITVNGLTYSDRYFKNTSGVIGIFNDPDQTKDEAVEGSINGETYAPSMTIYDGAHGISVPVDVRADYDRTFPIYGLSGCSYIVFRLIDSTKFSQFNLTARVRGRKFRTFDENGFVVSTSTSEAVGTGDAATRRFKLDFDDIAAISSLTVNGSAWSAGSETSQTGNVYHLNAMKGYVEFPANIPGVGHAIVATYTYYARAWSQNPAVHLVYLLTEEGRGKGFDESKINWTAANDLQEFCDDSVTSYNSNGTITGPRYTSNYAVDFRKPIQEHMRAVLDACHAVMFVSDGKFVMKARGAGTSVFSFTENNILMDSFQSELADRSDHPNRIKAFFHGKTTYNAETEVIREDVLDQADRESRIGNGGVVEDNLKFPAVDNQEQAERLAEIILREQVGSRWLCSLKTTVLGLAIEPGDVVDVTHPSQPAWVEKLFRVEEVATDEDGRMELKLSEYDSNSYA